MCLSKSSPFADSRSWALSEAYWSLKFDSSAFIPLSESAYLRSFSVSDRICPSSVCCSDFKAFVLAVLSAIARVAPVRISLYFSVESFSWLFCCSTCCISSAYVAISAEQSLCFCFRLSKLAVVAASVWLAALCALSNLVCSCVVKLIS